MLEHYFNCPYCGEDISMLLDPSVRHQVYVEDCEVCCNPIEVAVKFENMELQEFEIRNLDQ